MSRSAPRPAQPEDSDRLPAELLDILSRFGSNRAFPAHSVLINEGDDSDSIYIVLDGRVKVYSTSDDGRQIIPRSWDRASTSASSRSTGGQALGVGADAGGHALLHRAGRAN